MTTEFTLAIALMAAATIYLIVCTLPVSASWAVARTGRSVGLVVNPEVERLVRRRVVRRAVAALLGGIAGGALGILIVVVGELAASDGAYWILLGAYFAGVATTSAIGAITQRDPEMDDRPRLARTAAVSLTDYAPAIERIPARVFVAVTAVLAVVAVLFQVRIPDTNITVTASLVVIAILGLAALVLFEWASRRIVDRGRVATSRVEMAWDDALRSLSVRDVLTAPLVLGVWGTIFGLGVVVGPLLEATPFLGAPLSATVSFVGILFIPAVLIVSFVSRPGQHYLRRLWPDVVAQGQSR